MDQNSMALAEQFYREQKFQDAENELLKLVQIAPDDPKIHFALACTYTQLKKGEQAVEEFKRVLALAPQSNEAESSRKWLEHYSSISSGSTDASVSQEKSSQETEPITTKTASADATPDVIYCGQCGKDNQSANKYCGSCGDELTTAVKADVADGKRKQPKSSNGFSSAFKNTAVFLFAISLAVLVGYTIKQTFFISKKANTAAKEVKLPLEKKEEKLYEKYPKTFVCPESHIKELQISDIENFSDEDLRVCRNEIYARYGFPFGVKDLREHFEKLPWYKRNEKYDISILSKIEKRNAKFISDYEKKRGEIAKNLEEEYQEEQVEETTIGIGVTRGYIINAMEGLGTELNFSKIKRDDGQEDYYANNGIILINLVGHENALQLATLALFSTPYSTNYLVESLSTLLYFAKLIDKGSVEWVQKEVEKATSNAINTNQAKYSSSRIFGGNKFEIYESYHSDLRSTVISLSVKPYK